MRVHWGWVVVGIGVGYLVVPKLTAAFKGGATQKR